MNKRAYYLVLAALLLLLWHLPEGYASDLRGRAVANAAPLWRLWSAGQAQISERDSIAILMQENSRLQTLVKQELVLLEQLAALQPGEAFSDAVERHRTMVSKALIHQLEGLPSRVIYRAPASWNSSLWLDVGTNDNEQHGRIIVASKSPVLKDGALVGVVDYVGEHECRVRLLTDAGLVPAVRVARGSLHDHWLAQHAHLLKRQLLQRDDLLDFASKDTFLSTLSQLTYNLESNASSWLLAKGELHGASHPLWRAPGLTLKGIGFNYDFSDEEGPARNLYSGVPHGEVSAAGPLPLVKVKDLLITSGYDGVFPAGLPVAEVSSIAPLGEGDYFYELQAIPCAGNLLDIDAVLVLPPLNFKE